MATRLEEIDNELALIVAAKEKILGGGQAFTAEGRTMSRADLRELNQQERGLRAERARVARGSAVIYGVPI